MTKHARCLVLDMRGRDGDAASLLFGRFVNHGVVHELAAARLSEDFGDGCCERRFAVIDAVHYRPYQYIF